MERSNFAMGKIKCVAFDLGGVIVRSNQNEAVRRFRKLGLERAADYLDSYAQKSIFGELENGDITAEEFRRSLSELAGRQLSIEDCTYGWLGYFGGFPDYVRKLLLQLRRDGIRIVLLSNNNPFMMGFVRSSAFDGRGHSLCHYMDRLYVSYEMKVSKPNPEIFRALLTEEKLQPSELLFVDDGVRNVEAARKLGINALLVTNGEDWTEKFCKHLSNLRSL